VPDTTITSEPTLSACRSVVKLGEHNLKTKIDCEQGQCADPPQIIDAKVITLPKEYDDETLRHDIAIIELAKPAVITHFVTPVCLPTGALLRDDLMDQTVEVSETLAEIKSLTKLRCLLARRSPAGAGKLR
jgi:hypothetical protein